MDVLARSDVIAKNTYLNTTHNPHTFGEVHVPFFVFAIIHLILVAKYFGSMVNSLEYSRQPIYSFLLFTKAYALRAEWYDFTIYTQLSKTLGKLFFPNKDPVLTQLSFWGVYALGFISRPAGAIMFGHIGDSKGRGMCLLLSVLLMGIPTVLIGCLPTYHHIGLAAPIILAFLRLVQGLAMGGEFGAGAGWTMPSCVCSHHWQKNALCFSLFFP
jgi:hypothetical protein